MEYGMETKIEQPQFSENEIDLIKKLRGIPYGEITIFMHAGQPVRIEKGVESQTIGNKK